MGIRWHRLRATTLKHHRTPWKRGAILKTNDKRRGAHTRRNELGGVDHTLEKETVQMGGQARKAEHERMEATCFQLVSTSAWSKRGVSGAGKAAEALEQ